MWRAGKCTNTSISAGKYPEVKGSRALSGDSRMRTGVLSSRAWVLGSTHSSDLILKRGMGWRNFGIPDIGSCVRLEESFYFCLK